MTYVFQEFPKALYRKGVYAAVKNKADEDAMRAQGWMDYVTDKAIMEGRAIEPIEPVAPPSAAPISPVQAEPPKRGPGRPRKA
jgi:hypothetical protein